MRAYRLLMGCKFPGFTPIGNHSKQRVHWQEAKVVEHWKTTCAIGVGMVPVALWGLYTNWTNTPELIGAK